MDAFDFDKDDEVSTRGQGFHKSSMTASDECSATSSTRQEMKRGKLKYHRLNRIISSMRHPDNVNNSDFRKEGEIEGSVGQEHVSQSDASVSSVNSMHHTIDSLDESYSKRPRRRKKLINIMENKTKTQISHDYFSSSSPLDFSTQSSISSPAQRSSISSVITGSKGSNNYVSGGGYKQVEILSGDGFGTPPGSPPRRRRPTTQNNANRTDCSSFSSQSKKLDNSPRAEKSSMLASVPQQKPLCSSEYSVASEGTRQSSRSYGTKSSSHKRGNLWKSSQSSQSNASILSNDSERVTTGAGIDVYAMQDAGSSRLILDECNYVCNSFLTGIQQDDGSADVIQSQHSLITADAACDLANMLAFKSSRSILLKTACSDLNAVHANKEIKTTADSSCFESVLTVFGHVPSSVSGSYLPSCHIWYENGEINQEGHLIQWDKFISPKHKVNTMQGGKQVSMATPRTKSARNSLRTEKPCSELERSEIDCIVIDALAITAFYVSLDCTFDKSTSAASNHHSAKIFQRKLLRHKTFVHGTSKLLLADKLVRSILNSINPRQCHNLSSSNGDAKDLQHDDECGEKTVDLNKRSLVDPTSRGRRKKRRRLDGKLSNDLEPILEDMATSSNQHDDSSSAKCFDFFSDDTSAKSDLFEKTATTNDKSKLPSWLKRKIRNAYSRLATDILVKDKFHAQTCSFCSCLTNYADGLGRRYGNPGKLALDALHRLLTGKCTDDDDVLDDQDEIHQENEDILDDGDNYSDDEMKTVEEDIVEKDNLNNPMIFKNFMMRRSGAIPYLTRATTEALEACIAVNMYLEEQDKKCCDGCCQYLKNRVLRLLSLLDGLCCMSRKNREFLCLIAKKDNGQTVPLLIPSLLRTMLFFSRSLSYRNNSKFADVGLASLRTFTNLTHENKSASLQVSFLSVNPEPIQNAKPANGVEIILNLLYNLVESQNSENHNHHAHAYDGIIFCLNSLTNLLETASYQDVCKLIVETAVASNDQSEKFVDALPWISRWIVDQTSPFRDAVMSGSFGKSCNEEDKRDLKHDEDEFLVTAGNGFILLACLLGVHKTSKLDESDTSSKIRSIIFDSIPNHENLLLLMINTLKAFCNYYRYSVGDLSVAVITPVLHLITGLERISQC